MFYILILQMSKLRLYNARELISIVVGAWWHVLHYRDCHRWDDKWEGLLIHSKFIVCYWAFWIPLCLMKYIGDAFSILPTWYMPAHLLGPISKEVFEKTCLTPQGELAISSSMDSVGLITFVSYIYLLTL